MAASGGGDFLVQAATYLGAAAIAVPLFNRFKLGSILGYLAAGVVIGPSGLNILHQEEGVFHVAELGVVLFLFVIGLELSLARLWTLRRDIFGLGAAQMALTGLVIAGLMTMADVMSPGAAIIAGLSLSFSSTAFALQYMKDRGELQTHYGARAFPILLFQDLAVIPLLAAVPFVAVAVTGDAGIGDAGSVEVGTDHLADGSGDLAGWLAAGKILFVIGTIIVLARFAMNPAFRIVANSGSREAFAALALFIVAGVSLAVSWAGLSMALGAFLAGALLAESAYRHQIETDIEPFRGLLLGLFFISIGMKLNLVEIADNAGVVMGGAVGLVAIKAILLTGLARAFATPLADAAKTGAVLSQGGEFAFVIFTLGVSAALFTSTEASLMSAIVTISMILTPFMMMGARRLERQTPESTDDLEGPHHASGQVIVAGFGRMGQIIAQVVQNAGVDVIAIDRNPGHIRNAERFGFKVYFGDAARLDILETAGIDEARAIILCMDDRDAVNHAVKAIRASHPNACIHAVAHDRMHEIELRKLGPDVIVRETLESSLMIARKALEQMSFSDAMIDDFIQQFREGDRERLLQQIDYGPEAGKEILHRRFSRREP